MDHSIRAPLPSGLAGWVWSMEAGDEGQEARRPGIFCPCSLFSLHCLLAHSSVAPATARQPSPALAPLGSQDILSFKLQG